MNPAQPKCHIVIIPQLLLHHLGRQTTEYDSSERRGRGVGPGAGESVYKLYKISYVGQFSDPQAYFIIVRSSVYKAFRKDRDPMKPSPSRWTISLACIVGLCKMMNTYGLGSGIEVEINNSICWNTLGDRSQIGEYQLL